jgi:RHS repeat-associated protein
VEKTTATATRKFIYGPDGELLAEMDGAGIILHEYVYLHGRPVVDLYQLPDAAPLPATGEIVIDDPEATVIGANWQNRSDPSAIGGSYLRNRKRDGRSVRWYVDQPGFAGGPHDVFVRWLQPEGEGISTTYRVRVSGQPSEAVIVAHSAHNLGDWVLLGNFEFTAADGSPAQYVSLTGFDNDIGFNGTFLEADAVKIVPTSIASGSSEPRFIHGDNLGTPYFVTDLDGTIVWSATYLPFGEASVNEDPDGDGLDYTLNKRFPGQYFDVETGLHYNYFRDYDSQVGRYLESDPIGLAGGLNTYVYVAANPITGFDPLGLFQMCHRDLLLPIPYARHCYARFEDGSTSSFTNKGVGPDKDPHNRNTVCTPSRDTTQDQCIARAMRQCTADNYDFIRFNCCHCVEQALRECGTPIPVTDWPNWPINPGPQPGEPGYPPYPVYDPSLGG